MDRLLARYVCSAVSSVPLVFYIQTLLIYFRRSIILSVGRSLKVAPKKYIFPITSICQPTNSHIISHKKLLKHFKTLRHVSILSDHHQGPYFLAKVILYYSQFNWCMQMRCCGCISYCVGMYCAAVARCASYAE